MSFPGQEPYFLLRYRIMLWIGSRRFMVYADNTKGNALNEYLSCD